MSVPEVSMFRDRQGNQVAYVLLDDYNKLKIEAMLANKKPAASPIDAPEGVRPIIDSIAALCLKCGYDPHAEINDLRDSNDLKSVQEITTSTGWAMVVESMKQQAKG